jgi:large subunit ribosomal protein L3
LQSAEKKEDKLAFVKEHLDKEIKLSDVFKEGEFADVTAVTKGKGVQGVIKRFGVGRKQHKSEKGVRRVGSLGGWKSQGHVMYRTPQAGKMGFHVRNAYNLKILKISDNIDDIKVKGDHIGYGVVKNTYLLIKGSVPGSRKRLIRLNVAKRPTKKNNPAPMTLEYIDLNSKQ